MESRIDELQDELPPQTHFILPGGHAGERRAAPRAHRVPPCRAGRGAALPRWPGGRADPAVPQPAVRFPLRPGAGGEPPGRREGRAVDSGRDAVALTDRRSAAAGADAGARGGVRPLRLRPAGARSLRRCCSTGSPRGWRPTWTGWPSAPRIGWIRAGLLPGARTVVALGCNYWTEPGAVEASPIARYARGRDYHATLRDRLRAFRRLLRADWPGLETYGSVDHGPVHGEGVGGARRAGRHRPERLPGDPGLRLLGRARGAAGGAGGGRVRGRAHAGPVRDLSALRRRLSRRARSTGPDGWTPGRASRTRQSRTRGPSRSPTARRWRPMSSAATSARTSARSTRPRCRRRGTASCPGRWRGSMPVGSRP